MGDNHRIGGGRDRKSLLRRLKSLEYQVKRDDPQRNKLTPPSVQIRPEKQDEILPYDKLEEANVPEIPSKISNIEKTPNQVVKSRITTPLMYDSPDMIPRPHRIRASDSEVSRVPEKAPIPTKPIKFSNEAKKRRQPMDSMLNREGYQYPDINDFMSILSARSNNIIKKLGIKDVRKLMRFSAEDLLNERNMNQLGVDEIRKRLAQYNLKLRGD